MELEPCIPLPIEDKELLKEIVEKGKDWAVLHGIGMRSKDNFSRDSISFAPFLLLPSSFPETEFNKAKRIQPILNELMHKVAHDDEFLRKVLLETINVDPFMARLVQIYQEVLTEGVAQKISLGLFRSDYMVDTPSRIIKQVEFNTIASSFGALTSILPKWHTYALSLLLPEKDVTHNIPSSDTLNGYADGILHAYNLYSWMCSDSNPAILFVIEDMSINIGDQRLIEFEVQFKDPSVRVLRRTLTEIGNEMHLGPDKRMFLNGIEIAVIYYRAGYAPAFYHSDLEWNARLQMERSKAIKCPSIQYHLAGSKKVQQELARPGILENYLKDPSQVQAVREVFTGLYSLDMRDPTADNVIQLAIDNPTKYVLKPQREGGGNNLYDGDLSKHLKKIRNSEERHGWILMDKINPTPLKGYIIRPAYDEPTFTDVVSELGIFGVIIGSADKIELNTEVGHMLRTKATGTNEGGVAIGLGALDSLYLKK